MLCFNDAAKHGPVFSHDSPRGWIDDVSDGERRPGRRPMVGMFTRGPRWWTIGNRSNPRTGRPATHAGAGRPERGRGVGTGRRAGYLRGSPPTPTITVFPCVAIAPRDGRHPGEPEGYAQDRGLSATALVVAASTDLAARDSGARLIRCRQGRAPAPPVNPLPLPVSIIVRRGYVTRGAHAYGIRPGRSGVVW